VGAPQLLLQALDLAGELVKQRALCIALSCEVGNLIMEDVRILL